jgi:hypothetical protein
VINFHFLVSPLCNVPVSVTETTTNLVSSIEAYSCYVLYESFDREKILNYFSWLLVFIGGEEIDFFSEESLSYSL